MRTALLREYIRSVLLEYSDAACEYERSVIRTLKALGVAGRVQDAACSNANLPDADLVVAGEAYNVEVKSSPRAQMGGGSLRYSRSEKRFYPAGHSPEISQLVVDALNSMDDPQFYDDVERVVNQLHASATTPFHGVPMSGFTADTWQDVVQLGWLRRVNRTLDADISCIVQHYAHKDVHYMQIADCGLFWLGQNPANLPVPQLAGKVQLEVRIVLGGAHSGGGNRRTANFRVQARLLAQNSSPYSLDNPDDVAKMLNLAPKAHR